LARRSGVVIILFILVSMGERDGDDVGAELVVVTGGSCGDRK